MPEYCLTGEQRLAEYTNPDMSLTPLPATGPVQLVRYTPPIEVTRRVSHAPVWISAVTGACLVGLLSGFFIANKALRASQDMAFNNRVLSSLQEIKASGSLRPVSPVDDPLLRQTLSAQARLETQMKSTQSSLRSLVAELRASREPDSAGEDVAPADGAFKLNRDVDVVAGAQVHYDSLGQPDYWICQRQDGLVARMIPLGATDSGVLAHSMEDGHNYVLTREGGWVSNALTRVEVVKEMP